MTARKIEMRMLWQAQCERALSHVKVRPPGTASGSRGLSCLARLVTAGLRPGSSTHRTLTRLGPQLDLILTLHWYDMRVSGCAMARRARAWWTSSVRG